jgi:hypothetical protein
MSQPCAIIDCKRASRADRLTSLTLDKVTDNSRHKLNQWRIDYHGTIDQFYEQKWQELIDREETMKDDIDLVSSAIRTLGQKINEIE